jgi:hypothetical protein
MNGRWGTVCDDYWNDQNYPNVTQGKLNAMIACKTLGLPYTAAVAKPTVGRPSYGAGSGDIWMDNVQCTGSEATLFDCPRAIGSDCSHNEDVGE